MCNTEEIPNPLAEYNVIIINQGNGQWYHGYENPLQCRWNITGNIAICHICKKKVEKRVCNPIKQLIHENDIQK